MTLHPIVSAVTDRIFERSRPKRSHYLTLMDEQRERGVDRSNLACGNLAHGFALKALAAPFFEVRFCPTGGITATTAPDWLAKPSVACVGGSSVVGAGTPDLDQIGLVAKAAAALNDA